MRDDGIGWVLWTGTVGFQSSIEGRLEAAVAGGFGQMSLTPLDVVSADSGPEDLGRRLRDAGVDIVLEGFMTWYPGEQSAAIPLAAFTSAEVLGMFEALQAVSLTALARPTCDLSVDEVAKSFAAICDRAADSGGRVQLEFAPMMAIKDLPSASTIVEMADRANGGLVFDTWHFFRGNPDFAALASLSGDRVFAVQVADADATVQGSLVEDTFLRRQPGDGCFDLVRALQILDRIDALKWVGPEVISPTTAAMTPVDAARVGLERTRDLITRARS